MIAEAYRAWVTVGGGYQDIDGLCRQVSLSEIKDAGFTLLPAAFITQKRTGGPRRAQASALGRKTHDEVLAFSQGLTGLAETVHQTMEPGMLDALATQKPKSFRLHDVLELSEETLGDRPEPEILTCTERAGLILQRERFAKRIATENTSSYKLVRLTDVVYNPYLLWAGAIDQCWVVPLGITSPAYEVLRIRPGFEASLVGIALKGAVMMDRYRGISVGTVQRRKRAPIERFLELHVELPDLDVQRKLSPFLGALRQANSATRHFGRAQEAALRALGEAILA
jgi:hypothetical protein